MPPRFLQGFGTPRQVLWNLLLITAGSLVSAVAINGILIPHHFLSGGFVGLTLILYYLQPSLQPATVYALLNVVVFVVGWRLVGKRFFFYSLAGAAIFTLALEWVHVILPVRDQMLAALLAGIVSGVGAGLILRSFGSAGGADILSVILVSRYGISLGTTFLIMNSVILGAAAFIFNLEDVLYTLIYLFVLAKVANLVVSGLSQRKAVLIISQRWQAINQRILGELNRGATVIPAQGGYTGREEHLLYTVVTLRNLGRLKALVRQEDPEAFMVVTNTLEVMGSVIGNQPHW